MNMAGFLRIVLAGVLVLAIGSCSLTDWPMLFSLPPAQAQEDSPKPTLPRSRQNSEPEDEPRGRTAISVDVDLVTLQALVTDNKGNVLTGLKPENFTIYEDNVKQEIAHFSTVDANITVVMLVEYSKRLYGSSSTYGSMLQDVHNAMYAFTQKLRKGDWVAIMGYDMHTSILCDFTQNHQKIYDTLRQFTWPSWDESNVSDAVIEALDRTQELEGKVAILLISSGMDTFSRHTYEEALEACKSANASIYSIGVGQYFRLYNESRGRISQIDNLDYLMGDNRLKSFSEFTGGAAYFPRFPTELPAIVDNISMMLRSQYSIAYASSNTQKDGKFRKIRIEVKSDLLDAKGKPLKLKVTTRKGYTPRAL